jgi:hypothetical protein
MPRFGAPHPTNTTSACPALAAIVRIAVDDDAGEGDLMATAARNSNADDVERTDEANIAIEVLTTGRGARWREAKSMGAANLNDTDGKKMRYLSSSRCERCARRN